MVFPYPGSSRQLLLCISRGTGTGVQLSLHAAGAPRLLLAVPCESPSPSSTQQVTGEEGTASCSTRKEEEEEEEGACLLGRGGIPLISSVHTDEERRARRTERLRCMGMFCAGIDA